MTSDNTVVLLADFYRQGDGNDESFTALMIVSAVDLPGHPGKNVWIQGVGCGSAVVNFNTAHLEADIWIFLSQNGVSRRNARPTTTRLRS
jgi:hypothetical protein